MQAYRKVALHLHGLHETDRRWLLAQLPRQHAYPLRALLGELSTLGIPRESSLLAELSAPSTTVAANLEPVNSAPEGAAANLSAAVSELQSADPGQIVAVLTGECDGVVAAILASHPWSWRDTVLARFTPPRQRQIVDALKSARDTVSAPARDALLAGLLDQMYRLPADTTGLAPVATNAVTDRPKPRWRFWGNRHG